MTRFEYLTVLDSIVVALGITEVTFSWARLIQNRERVKFSGLHSFWSAFALLLMVQFWWSFWNYRVIEDWSLFWLMTVVLESIVLVICALMLTPSRSFTGEIDLEQHYYRNARPFFLFGAVLMVQLSVGDTLILGGLSVFHQENLVRGTGAVIAATLAWSSSRRLHRAFPYIASILFAIFLLNAIML